MGRKIWRKLARVNSGWLAALDVLTSEPLDYRWYGKHAVLLKLFQWTNNKDESFSDKEDVSEREQNRVASSLARKVPRTLISERPDRERHPSQVYRYIRYYRGGAFFASSSNSQRFQARGEENSRFSHACGAHLAHGCDLSSRSVIVTPR